MLWGKVCHLLRCGRFAAFEGLVRIAHMDGAICNQCGQAAFLRCTRPGRMVGRTDAGGATFAGPKERRDVGFVRRASPPPSGQDDRRGDLRPSDAIEHPVIPGAAADLKAQERRRVAFMPWRLWLARFRRGPPGPGRGSLRIRTTPHPWPSLPKQGACPAKAIRSHRPETVSWRDTSDGGGIERRAGTAGSGRVVGSTGAAVGWICFERGRSRPGIRRCRVSGSTGTGQQAVTLTARPPSEVSLYFSCMSAPVWRMVSIT